MNEGTRCPRDYVRDPSQSNWNLNDITIVQTTNQFQLYFPRPWIIVGLSDLRSVPAGGPPAYPVSSSAFLSPADHQVNDDIFQSVFLDLAFSTMRDFDASNIVNYVGPGIQGKDYRGYFVKYLSSTAMNETRQWYNAVIQPESIVKDFCEANAAATSDVWLSRWFEMVRFLEKTMWPSFMGAPGIYTIKRTGSGGGSPDWDSQTEYETYQNL